MPPNTPYFQPQQPAPQAPLPSSGGGFGGESSLKWIITIVLLVLLLLGAAGFGFWAFGERQDYKDNVDGKIATAVKDAEKATTDANNKKFAEELKNPLKTYTGPESYGSVRIQYPKTWSGYVSTGSTGQAPVDAYFHPDIVPSTTTSGTTRPAIALHVQVLNQAYDQVVSQRQGSVNAGTLTAAPYALPKMPQQAGMKFTGKLSDQLNGTEIVLPLRDKTIVITTETDSYLNDFNTFILPNMTFVP